MKLVKVSVKNRRAAENFAKKEWQTFNKERGYRYQEQKYAFVLVEKKKVLGYASWKINGKTAYLSQLIIAKGIRRKGIGKVLLKEFERFAKFKKCHKVFLETSEKHAEAISFYRKHGYKTAATLKNHKFGYTWYLLEKYL